MRGWSWIKDQNNEMFVYMRVYIYVWDMYLKLASKYGAKDDLESSCLHFQNAGLIAMHHHI